MTVYTKALVQSMIEKRDEAVIRAVMSIYTYQTDHEKVAGYTEEDNGVGFNGLDAPILSSFAEWYKAKGFLSPKQISIARRKMKKYWRQLLRIAQDKGYEVQFK